jgi:hypothetical protein
VTGGRVCQGPYLLPYRNYPLPRSSGTSGHLHHRHRQHASRGGPVCTGRAIIFNSNSSSINLPRNIMGYPIPGVTFTHLCVYEYRENTAAPRCYKCEPGASLFDHCTLVIITGRVCILFSHCAGSRAFRCIVLQRIFIRVTRLI